MLATDSRSFNKKKRRPQAGASSLKGQAGSDDANLLRLRALLTLGGLELHPLTFIE